MEVKFIADVHLGKLARLLRMIGFDTLYKNSFVLSELLQISKAENRILLSKNSSLQKIHPDKNFVVPGEDPYNQLRAVINHFDLKNQFHPFSRCIACNGVLRSILKESIVHLLPENTIKYFNEFWQCSNCRRIYWKGSHYERMLKTIEAVTG